MLRKLNIFLQVTTTERAKMEGDTRKTLTSYSQIFKPPENKVQRLMENNASAKMCIRLKDTWKSLGIVPTLLSLVRRLGAKCLRTASINDVIESMNRFV